MRNPSSLIVGAATLGMLTMAFGGCFRGWDDYDPNVNDSTGAGSGALCGGLGVLTDDFEDGHLNERFSTDEDGAVFEQGGELVLAPHLDTGGCFTATVHSKHAFDLTGRALGFELRALPPPSTGASFSILLRGSATNALQIAIDNDNVSFSRTVNEESQTLASQRYSAADHRFFRFREAEGAVHWETSGDGQAWIERAKADVATLFDVRFVSLEMNAPGDDIGTPAEVRIDNLGGGEAESCCAMGSFADDFEDGTRSAAWSVPECLEGCAMSESGGELSFILDAGAPDPCAYTTTSAYDLRGSAISMEVTSPPAPTSEGNFLFQLIRDSDNFLEFQIANGELHCAQTLGGECGEDLAFTQFSAADHRWLRFREQDGTIYFETSPDGVTWNAHTSVIQPFGVEAMQVKIQGSAKSELLAPVEIRMDNVNLAP